jgi:cytoskeletal protein RodZ
MALLSRGNQSELPESQIEYNNNEGGKRWVVLVVYIVMALVVATLVVFAGRWVYHKVSNNNGPTPTTLAPQGTNQGAENAPNPVSPTPPSTSPTPSTTPTPSSNSSGKVTTPTPTPTTSPTPSTNKAGGTGKVTPGPTPTSLPNNGPGEAIVLFLGVTFVAGSLHFIANLRKTTRSI